jgi:hypothetical protein
MLIRILAGAYGHRPDSEKSYIEKKDKDSDPFEVNDKEAARLIGLGIAEKAAVNTEKEPDKIYVPADPGGQDDDLEQLPIQKLRKMAKDLGLPADGSKAVLAEKIRNVSKIQQNQEVSDDLEEEGDETDISDKEAPPILQAADPEV